MCIRNNIDLVFINVFIKIHPFVLKILRRNTFLHQSRAITLLFINEFSPFAIPNHSSLISMSMQSLKKIGQKLLRVRKRSADRWMLKRFGGYNTIPPPQKVAGYSKMACAPSEDRSAWASAQSDQSLLCPHEESFGH